MKYQISLISPVGNLFGAKSPPFFEISTTWLQLRPELFGSSLQESTKFLQEPRSVVCWSLLQCKNVEFLGILIREWLELLGLRQCARQKSVFRKSREKLWMKQTDCRHCFGDSGRLSLQICMISPDPTNVYQRYDMFSSFDTNEKDSNGTKDCNMPTIPWTMLSKTQKHQNSHCLKRDASTTYSVRIILLYCCTLVYTSFTHASPSHRPATLISWNCPSSLLKECLLSPGW